MDELPENVVELQEPTTDVGRPDETPAAENEDLFSKSSNGATEDYIKNEILNKTMSLTTRDVAKLKFNNYEKIKDKFNIAFLIYNTQTRQLAEIRAASVVHAANLIGWRIRKVKLLAETDLTETDVKEGEV